MDKIQYCAIIKFFVKEGLTPNEFHSKFIKVYGDSSPSFSTIKKWAAEFKLGHTSLEDEPCEGRPKCATTPEIIEQVHDMVLDDQQMKVCEIVETIGISKECVGYILHEKLDMKKLCIRWVPCLLTAYQKRTRMKISEQCMERFNKNKTDFVRRFIVQRQRRKGRFHQQERSVASVFWYAESILFFDYLVKGKTITVEYYSNILTRLDEKNRQKRPGLQKKNIIFHQDNAHAHKSVSAMGKLRDLH
jgi:transposase